MYRKHKTNVCIMKEVVSILFRDYTETKRIYHVVTLTDLEKTLSNGICFSDKNTYKSKYYDFHNYIDLHKPGSIPDWVVRSKAIFGSMNFKSNHIWHSHSAILSIRINEELCWVCNENIANFLYEPLVLQDIPGYEIAKDYIKRNGEAIVGDYWNCSCSFKENLKLRRDMKTGYDAEVLILHDILPEDIEVLYIASDHRFMKLEEWQKFFAKNDFTYSRC